MIEICPGAEPIPGYRLERYLGGGGYGKVWEAIQIRGEIPVAIKFITTGPVDLEKRGISYLRRVRHAHLVDIHLIEQVGEALVIVMSLCDGTLLGKLKSYKQQGLPGIPFDDLEQHMLQAADAIDYLNRPIHEGPDGGKIGIQHRDIKPENIFLAGGSVKVADFGLAKALEKSMQSRSRSGMTAAYAPPEFFEEKTSERSDQYSLAASYVHLRQGRTPYSGSGEEIFFAHLRRMSPDLSGLARWERPIIERAMARNPADRWPSCTAMVQALIKAQCSVPSGTFVSPSIEGNGPANDPAADTAVATVRNSDPAASPSVASRNAPASILHGRTGTALPVWTALMVLLLVVGLGLFILLTALGSKGEVQITYAPPEPDVRVFVDEQEVPLEKPGQSAALAVTRGIHTLTLQRGDAILVTQSIEVAASEPLRMHLDLPLGKGDPSSLVGAGGHESQQNSKATLAHDQNAQGDGKARPIPPRALPVREEIVEGTVATVPLREGVENERLGTEGGRPDRVEPDSVGLPEEIENSVGMILIRLPAGTFSMGAPPTERFREADEAFHEVTCTRPFFIGVFEVTQGEYREVTGLNPSAHSRLAPVDEAKGLRASSFPVEQVSWFDAVQYCNRLSAMEGLPQYYRVLGEDVTILGGNGYRLPTEAEWEYACRAGTTTPFHTGDGLSSVDANFDGDFPYLAESGVTLGRPTTVGSYPPNPLGIHDMHGNLWEWCWDRYAADYYEDSPTEDPMGPDEGTMRVVRGGGWSSAARDCRSANRMRYLPTHRSSTVGFRVARDAP